MLSYSTGSSGTGTDVEKVSKATAIVRERAPELLVEGPIQYDAAIDAAVARTKLPDSPVAGRATVFIFPDLNTGNNTYKAVQRSANAVAVGPVLQGLRKPVNDLSRGATVRDIVNTVAITARAGTAGRQPMNDYVLVINAGSSSLKYSLIHAESGEAAADGLIERIGESEGRQKHRGRTARPRAPTRSRRTRTRCVRRSTPSRRTARRSTTSSSRRSAIASSTAGRSSPSRS